MIAIDCVGYLACASVLAASWGDRQHPGFHRPCSAGGIKPALRLYALLLPMRR